MKQNHKNKRSGRRSINTYCPAYPNAADPAYFTEKALEILAACVSGFGAVSFMVLLMALS
ncbi:MAG: hypothetical protein IKU68_07385 [Oscillospiraceae bacterium]|nr:hypothetical protein [Oscillospiraceae bacterium]